MVAARSSGMLSDVGSSGGWRIVQPQARHTPRMRGSSTRAASRFHHRRLWNTGSPAFAGDDSYHLGATPHSRGAIRPSCASNRFAPKRAWGMPGARCTRSRAWCVESTRVSHHGRTGITRHSRTRMVLTVSFALSLVTGLSCHHRLADCFPRNLTPASGRQDHTTSPSALAPFVKSAATSTASRPNVRDDRETPLVWDGMAGDMEVICAKREGKYFFGKDWTGSISLIRFGKLDFRRRPRKRSRTPGRHCERSEAIHCATKRKNGLLRRFASRNDVVGFRTSLQATSSVGIFLIFAPSSCCA